MFLPKSEQSPSKKKKKALESEAMPIDRGEVPAL